MNIIPLPTTNRMKNEDALARNVEFLVDVFRELHEVERMTGRSGLSARVRLAIMDVIALADNVSVS